MDLMVGLKNMDSSSGWAVSRRIWCCLGGLFLLLWRQITNRVMKLKARRIYLKEESAKLKISSIRMNIQQQQNQMRGETWNLVLMSSLEILFSFSSCFWMAFIFSISFALSSKILFWAFIDPSLPILSFMSSLSLYFLYSQFQSFLWIFLSSLAIQMIFFIFYFALSFKSLMLLFMLCSSEEQGMLVSSHSQSLSSSSTLMGISPQFSLSLLIFSKIPMISDSQ